ncbi:MULTISPECIES: hypothetical protein [Microcoleaceae]|uniref:hypothetical protein n=1 Tax=Microcoleaceae TaxID=1892252 RepID=UPI001882B2A2|nr:hypothetical protein [Tychonema sp. LEGE 06208]MBE9163647.1 hypothetical protein [Tychonema sp. LEGE 06208]
MKVIKIKGFSGNTFGGDRLCLPRLTHGQGQVDNLRSRSVKLWRCYGIDRLIQSLPQLAAILYNRARPKTDRLRATNTSQSVSSARAPLEECLADNFDDRFSICIYELP